MLRGAVITMAVLAVASARAPSAIPAEYVNALSAAGDLTWGPCRACEWGVRFAEDMLADPENQNTLEHLTTTTICDALPSAEATTCTAYVHDVLPKAVHYVEDRLSPRIVCSPLCPGAVLLSPSPIALHEPPAWECPFCEFIAQTAQTALRNQTTQQAVLDNLRHACNVLPPSFEDTCMQYVNEKGPLILLLLETLQPDTICRMIGACPRDVRAALQSTQLPNKFLNQLATASASLGRLQMQATCPAPTPSQGIGRETQSCQFCKVAVMEVHAEIAQPAFQRAATAYAEKVCESISQDFAPQCKAMVHQYSPLVFSMLEEYLEPEQFCTLVHLCEPTQST